QTIADMTGYAYQPPMPVLPMPGMAPPAQGLLGRLMGGVMGQPAPAPGPQAGLPQLPMPQQPPGQPAPQAASPSGQTFGDEEMALLRDDNLRSFLIDVETDSTIQPDEDAEKQRRVEFITAVGQFVNQGGQALLQAPSLVPMFKES